MGRLLVEFAFVLTMLAGLGVAGGFVVMPFRRALPFAILACPFAGLLCTALGMAACYSLLGWTLARCATASGIACGAATLVALSVVRPAPRWRELGLLLAIVAPVAVSVTCICESATLHFHGPAILYADATDQLGYAHMADWIMAHPVSVEPPATPTKPYGAYLSYLFHIDPRFGSFLLLGLIATLRHVPAAFAYDNACAVFLTAAVLGVAGVFAQSRQTLLVLVIGLLGCHWYEYGRLGFFGKMLAYPAVLMLVGLFIAMPDAVPLGIVCLLAMLAAATALTHSGLATAMLFTAAVGVYLMGQSLAESGHRPHATWDSVGRRLLTAALVAGTAIVTTGLLARPLKIAFQDWHLGWNYILPRVIGLEYHGAVVAGVTKQDDVDSPLFIGHPGGGITGIPTGAMTGMTIAGFAIWAALAAAALARRNCASTGLLIGPMLLLGGFMAAGARAGAFQLVGLPYPFMLCGAVLLIDDARRAESQAVGRSRAAFVAGLVIVSILLRAPRLAGSIRHYAGPGAPKMQRFSMEKTDRLAKAIGDQSVEVDVTSPTHAIFLLVELGRRNVHLQWTPQSWCTVLAYTYWPTPSFPPARFKVQVAIGPVPAGWTVVCRAMPYRLLERK